MSLNNIQLGANQLVQLYGNVLVQMPSDAVAENKTTAQAASPPVAAEKVVPPPEAVPEAPFIRSLGGNAKKILILVQKEKEAFLPDGELKFLTAVLTACGLSLADIALVNHAAITQKTYTDLTEHFGSRQVVLFDVTPAQLGMPINFPPFQVQTFKECKYVHAPQLHLIEADVNLKKSLWAALKNLFGI